MFKDKKRHKNMTRGQGPVSFTLRSLFHGDSISKVFRNLKALVQGTGDYSKPTDARVQKYVHASL